MQEQDKQSIRYLSDPTRIADLLNAYLYQGKQLLTPDNIKERTRDTFADENKEKKTAIKMITRDIVRELQIEAKVILIAFENQSGIHYAMPVRIMRGDAFYYQEQWSNIAKEHRLKRDLKGDEFLSGFSKEDKLIPVIAICIYLGEAPWDGPRCLKDILELEGLPKEICERIADYPLNLLEINTFSDIEQLHSDLRFIFGFLQRRNDGAALKSYVQENENIFQNLPEDAYDFLSVFSNTKELDEIKTINHERGECDMCKAIKDLIEEGRQEGERFGRQEGERFGRQEGERLAAQVIHMSIHGESESTISKRCEIPVEKVQEILQLF